jgi:hypothetical protein
MFDLLTITDLYLHGTVRQDRFIHRIIIKIIIKIIMRHFVTLRYYNRIKIPTLLSPPLLPLIRNMHLQIKVSIEAITIKVEIGNLYQR